MIYTLRCTVCEYEIEKSASIHDGPPELCCEKCGEKMYNVLGGNFILRGEFPGKTIKRERQGENTKAIESFERHNSETKELKENAAQCLAARRKGTDEWRRYQKANPKSVAKYKEATEKGLGAK